MPEKITKVKGGYRVSTPHRVTAKRTTKRKAEAQARLLRAVKHGWKPTGKKRHHSAANGGFLDKRMSKFGID